MIGELVVTPTLVAARFAADANLIRSGGVALILRRVAREMATHPLPPSRVFWVFSEVDSREAVLESLARGLPCQQSSKGAKRLLGCRGHRVARPRRPQPAEGSRRPRTGSLSCPHGNPGVNPIDLLVRWD